MSQTRLDSFPNASSKALSNFQLVLNSALEAYAKKPISKDLARSLTTKIESCNSPDDIIIVLNDLIRQIDRRRSRDKRLTNWLGPTVKVLHVFSAALGEVGLVSFNSLSSH
jgi:hypothetical protein